MIILKSWMKLKQGAEELPLRDKPTPRKQFIG